MLYACMYVCVHFSIYLCISMSSYIYNIHIYTRIHMLIFKRQDANVYMYIYTHYTSASVWVLGALRFGLPGLPSASKASSTESVATSLMSCRRCKCVIRPHIAWWWERRHVQTCAHICRCVCTYTSLSTSVCIYIQMYIRIGV